MNFPPPFPSNLIRAKERHFYGKGGVLSMRKLIRMAGLILLSWMLVSSVAAVPSALSQPSSPKDQAQVLGDARLSLIQGDIAIQTGDTGDEWGAAATNMPLIPGMKIWNPENGRSEIQFLDGSYLRASSNTEVDITNLRLENDGEVIQVGVPQGRSYISDSGLKNSVFQVDTPNASILSYGSSKFQVDTYNDGTTEVSVLRGSVYVEGQNGRTQVDAGAMLSIDSNQNAELSAMRPEDAWISWNLSRDPSLARAGGSRNYLPASLDVYSNDFDANGRWVSTADYGNVWTPTAVVAGWAPYRLGRWCWIGGDYVWVSYDPWGWAPYHYGRWAFLASIGWCWVPPPATAVYWGPGFVAWINTPAYVSWVPLAPREIYYGHGYYGPHSVNITNVNINRINTTNVYANAKVLNAVTVVNRRTFLTGRSERAVNAPKNPFAAGIKPSIGRPDIKPERATVFPNPAKELPPREIVTTAEKIRNRPIAVHKDDSVFKPGERAASMRVTRIERPKPITSVQRPEPGKAPMQRGEANKAPSERREVSPSPGRQPGGPSTQREFGVAPSHKGEPESSPPARREEMNRQSPPTSATPQTQRPQSVAPKSEQMGPPPVQRKEVSPPPAQRGQPGAPPAQREFGVAPSHQGEPKSSPPARKEEMNRSSPPASATPQTQRPQSIAPKSEQMGPPPVQRKEVSPPPAKRGQPGAPPAQREFGVAPQHQGQPNPPPAPRKEHNPPPQTSRPTPPATGRESPPPAHMSSPVPPAPKGATQPSVQRNMGVAPPHAGPPSPLSAPRQPQPAPSGAPHRGAGEKENPGSK